MSVESIDCQQLIELEGDPIESIIKHFSKSGYITADGTKFGGDLVIYSPAGPELTHSKYLLFLIEPKVTWRDIISYYRVASQTAKIPLLAQIYKESKHQNKLIKAANRCKMANDGLKHVVHRRVHLERSQPEHLKRKVGQFLEKKTDYKKRAERYHVREKLIKELSAKTRFRNEDEFNFKMIHAKIGSEGQVILESEESAVKRKLSEKERVKNELKAIDTNKFIVNHKQNVINKRLDRMITTNVGLLSKRKPVAINTSSKELNGNKRPLKSTRKSHIIYETSDSDEDTSKRENKTSIVNISSSTGKTNSTKNKSRNGSKETDNNEQLFNLSDMFNSKKELDELRFKLEDKRNLTVAKYKRRQVRKVRNSKTKIHEYPTERLK